LNLQNCGGKVEGVAQEVEFVPSKHEAMNSNPQYHKKKKKKKDREK
jgi:hypothetical protein